MSIILCWPTPVIAAGSCRGSGCQAQRYERGFHGEEATNNEGHVWSWMHPKVNEVFGEFRHHAEEQKSQ